MPPQGPLPGRDDREFGLIETFRWTRDGGFALRAEHLARLGRSAGALGFAFDRERVAAQLRDFARGRDGAPSRVRLVLARDGATTLSAAPLGPPATALRVALAGPRHPSADPLLRHKTTLRDRYEHPLAAATASGAVDEVLFLNERDELCEGARANLFVLRDGALLTPPLRCGLLPGTLRARLLRTGAAREAVLHRDDLMAAWFLGNSVRGLVPAALVAPPPDGPEGADATRG